MRTFIVATALAALASESNAFWGTGHLLVSRQAQAILESEAPEVLSQALDMLAPLKKYYSSITKDEGDHPFTECATFADDIKGQGYSWQSSWHYVNKPYLDEGGSVEDYSFEAPPYDIVHCLDDLTGFLKGTVTASDSYYVNKIASYFSYYEDQQSFALRLIIHYLGDIHQPLHAVAKVDSTYPSGDEGGNYEHISPSVDGVSNLHSVWDSVIYQFVGYPDLPLSNSDWDWYTSTAQTMYESYPVNSNDVNVGDHDGWAQESVDISKNYVYPNYGDGDIPSQEYQDQAKPIIEYRMMLGARRLADTMIDIYSSSSKGFLQ